MLHFVYLPVVFLAGVALSPIVRRFFYGEAAKIVAFEEKHLRAKK